MAIGTSVKHSVRRVQVAGRQVGPRTIRMRSGQFPILAIIGFCLVYLLEIVLAFLFSSTAVE